MKVLKLNVYQQNASYKKPFAFKVAETYPLPPYSTVKGFLHKIINAKEFIPMSISVQGSFENICFNLQSMYSYKSKKNKAVTSVPSYVHMLYNVNLIIHVFAQQHIIDAIIEGIKDSYEYFSLGRKEDLAVIEDVKQVDIEEIIIGRGKAEPYEIKCPVYIPKKQLPSGLSGINYRLNWKYTIQNELRVWERIDTVYVESGNVIDSGTILLDEEKDLVFFNEW
ncbi:MAG: type I-B CRISPR-associated protein Cas5b [Defluviitoga tunisiensis]